MQPFSINCTTCQARLTVRSAAAIGQILSCPRCHSMVLVEPPGSSPAETPPAASPAARPDGGTQALPDTLADDPLVTDSGFPAGPGNDSEAEIRQPPADAPPADSGWAETVGELPLTDQAWGSGEPPPSTVKSRWKGESVTPRDGSEEPLESADAADGALVEGQLAEDDGHSSNTLSRDEISQDEISAGAGPVLPDAAWSSPATRRLSRWLLLGVSGVTGVVLAFLVLGFLLSRSSDPGDTLAGGPAVDDAATAPPAEANAEDQDGTGEPGEDDSGDAGGDRGEATETDETLAASRQPPKDTSESTDAESDGPASRQESTRNPPGAATQPGSSTPGGSQPAGRDPDDARPEAAADGGLASGETGSEPRPPAPSPAGKPEDPPGLSSKPRDDAADDEGEVVDSLLEQFAPLMRQPQFGGENVAEAPAEVPDAEEQAGDEAQQVLGPERPAPLDIDVAARLAEPIVAISLDETPLENLLRFATRFSTVPITLDTDALERRQISYRTPVTLKQNDTTLDQVLRAALEPLGLTVTVGDSQLRITAAETTAGRWTHPVDDLIGAEGTDAQTLSRWIQELVLPGTWGSGEGSGAVRIDGTTLTVNHTPAAQFGVLELLEKLRSARGLSSRAEQESPTFGLPTRTQRASEKLAERFLVNFVRPTPLTRILERMGNDSGTRILIDWQALLQAGWTPETELRFSSDNRPLRVALHSLLRPLDLAYRVVDAETLEVTTQEALRRRAELELYRVDDLLAEDADAAKLMERIRTTLGADLFSPQGSGALQFDPASRCLLVRLSQPRQLEVHELLMQLRA